MPELVFKNNLEQLYRDSERLSIIKDYVLSVDYISKDTLLTLLGGDKDNADKQ